MSKIEEQFGGSFRVTYHAKLRFEERAPSGLDLDVELQGSVPLGAQRGEYFMRLLPCGLVATGAFQDGERVITTVLVRDHAMANMQASGVRMNRLDKITEERPAGQLAQRTRTRPMPSIATLPPIVAETVEVISRVSTPTSGNAIFHLAVRHAIHSVPKSQRKREVAEHGIALSSEDGDEYKAAYKGSKLTVDVFRGMFRELTTNGTDASLSPEIMDAMYAFWRKLESWNVDSINQTTIQEQ